MLAKRYNLENNKIKVINNAVDINNFNLAEIKRNSTKINFLNEYKYKKIIGYIGTISEWFDYELIKSLSEKYPEFLFCIIGPVNKEVKFVQENKSKNIIFPGSIPYKEVPNMLNNFDVAIMPFKNNKLVQAVNPVKIYEYLALNKPVIALRYKETEKFSNHIYLYNTIEEFEICLKKALNEDNNLNIDRLNFALSNSWKSRVDEFESFIN